MWSLVTGFEAVDIRCLLRGPSLFNNFVTEVDRGLIKREVAVHDLNYVLRLLKINDYRKSLKEKDSGDDFPVTYRESNVTTHVRVLFNVGFDLKTSLLSTSGKHMSRKRKRASNFGVIISPHHQPGVS